MHCQRGTSQHIPHGVCEVGDSETSASSGAVSPLGASNLVVITCQLELSRAERRSLRHPARITVAATAIALIVVLAGWIVNEEHMDSTSARVLELQTAAGSGEGVDRSTRIRQQWLAKVLAESLAKSVEKLVAERRPSPNVHSTRDSSTKWSRLHQNTDVGRPTGASNQTETAAGGGLDRRGRGGAHRHESADEANPANSATQVSRGMQGENTPFVKALNQAEEAWEEAWSDDDVSQLSAQKQQGRVRWWPFGRDRVTSGEHTDGGVWGDFGSPNWRVEQDRDAGVTYRDFPDAIVAPGQAASFRARDRQVPVIVAGAGGELGAGERSVNGSRSLVSEWGPLGDRWEVQAPGERSPLPHRKHSDFDLQGLLPDVTVSARLHYDAEGGDDPDPAGIEDVLRPPPPPLEAAGQRREEWDVPRAWRDQLVARGAGPVQTQAERTVHEGEQAAQKMDFANAVSALGRAVAEEVDGEGDFADARVHEEGAGVVQERPLLPLLASSTKSL